jgi:signal transduction histidine kinase
MASDRFELSRLKQIVQGVDKISSRANPSERITVSGNDEITGLAESINDMLAALQKSEEVLKEKAAQLQRAVIEAQAANDAKTEFLAGVSHELRTPLTAIIGMTQLLEKQYYGKLNDKQTEYVKDILDSSAHLLSLINDILDLSRIESDKYELEISGVPVKELLSESLLLIGPEARKKNIHIRQNITDEILNRTIFVDKRRFEQITVNILSNAIKFTPARGNITIEAEEKDSEMEFRITDTGTGIRHEDIERIFEAFYQADTGTAGKTPGTGLGLSLVRHLVELHHGRVRAESEGAGKGSRFIFTIPLDLAENRPALD